MKRFSTEWKSSRKPRKQRKYRLGAPLHIKQKLVHSHLSKELRKKYGRRSVGLRKGDRVKVMRGKFRKHEGKVESINIGKTSVLVSGAEITKKDGNKKLLGLHPSNLMITEMNIDDKLRQKILERK
ncbi:50S ribosomal protein L24 [Candidatus Woesearchaeota archaeon]|nr:50S ribosomal protein L24 [Candidatus Woesearchaeota archaeon]